MKKYTVAFNQIIPSNYGKGSDAFNNILEYEGNFCYTPTKNACIGKCLKYNYKRVFSRKYREFIQNSERSKNIVTLARVQAICRKQNLDIGVYSLKKGRRFPETVREKDICLHLY